MLNFATRRSSMPARKYSRAPAADDGRIAGRGDATAMAGGTPSRARIGVANADPPAPKSPKVTPTPAPARTNTHHCMPPCSAGGAQKSKT